MKLTDKSARGLAARLSILAFVLTLIAVGLAQEAKKTDSSAVHGIVVANMDHSVKPGDNFFLYANGDWIKRTEIPPDRGGVSGFTALLNIADKNTADIIEEAAKSKAPAGSEAQKLADLYNAYMDEAAIDKRGLAPLKPMLDAISAIKDKQQLAHALGETLRADVDPLNNTNYHTQNLFGLWGGPGFSDYEH